MAVRYGATITVASTGRSYHTYTDWGLMIENGAPIGDPEQETSYIDVPGRSGLLDHSDALTGGPVFKGRKITMKVAKVNDAVSWDGVISTLRNTIDGRQVKIKFDNDPSHYWLGRIRIEGFDRAKRLGRFTLSAYVDAYKYNLFSSQDNWLWDPFNFEEDTITYIGVLQITDSGSVVIPKGAMPVVPRIRAQNIVDSITMTVGSKTYQLVSGWNRFPDLKVSGASEVTLNFTGTARITIDYRGGSL